MKAKIKNEMQSNLSHFCTAKETIQNKQTKKELAEWDKTFANDLTDRGLISEIYKQLIQLNNSRKQTTLLISGKKT